MRILFLLIVILISYIHSTAQYQNRYWHFGYNVCLDFAGGEPAYVSGSAMQSNEGCATQCDAAGNLLFYSNGETVYNKLNQVMDNGDSIGGHNSSAQSVVIVPDPGNTNEYYLFTTDAYEHQFQNGLCWSKVNMAENGGLGKVYVKKQTLITNGITERLIAVKRPGCLGYWVVTYQEQGNYIVYDIDESGIQSPVSYPLSLMIEHPLYKIGEIILNTSGTFIANYSWFKRQIEILNFNLSNGALNNPILINKQNVSFIKGASFIDDSTLIISTESPHRLYKLIISTNSVGEIETTIDSINIGFVPARLSRPINNSLYIAREHKKFISSLSTTGSFSINNLSDSAVVLLTKCRIGMPNEVVIPSPQHYPPQAFFTADVLKICPDSCIAFKNTSCDAYQFEWFFEGGVPSYSTEKNPQNICYPESGNYGVMLVAHHGTYSDTAFMPDLIQVYETPQFSIAQNGNILYCSNPQPGNTYQWYLNGIEISGATTSTYEATQNGTYQLQVTGAQGCKTTQSIEVIVSGYSYPMSICDVSLINLTEPFIQINNTGSSRVQYHLTDVNGRIIHKGELTAYAGHSITLEGSGVYFLQVQCELGVKVYKVIGM